MVGSLLSSQAGPPTPRPGALHPPVLPSISQAPPPTQNPVALSPSPSPQAPSPAAASSSADGMWGRWKSERSSHRDTARRQAGVGGGPVCSPTPPLFRPFAGSPIFPPAPFPPSPPPPARHTHPPHPGTQQGLRGRKSGAGALQDRRQDRWEGLLRVQRAGRGHIGDEEQ